MGRFISRDPIGMSDDINLYTYVANSPVKYVDPSGTIAKQMVANGWSAYMGWSDNNGEYLYDLTSVINQSDVVNDLERIRNYGGYTSLASIPFFFFPATVPVGVGIALGAGGTSLAAGATQTAITGDFKPLGIEAGSALAGPAVGWAGKTVGVLSKIEFNTEAMRYTGYYAGNAYGFISTQTASFGYAVVQSVEQISGFLAGQMTN